MSTIEPGDADAAALEIPPVSHATIDGMDAYPRLVTEASQFAKPV
ncbi:MULTISPECIES: hypothetical protein [Cupriavidus]